MRIEINIVEKWFMRELGLLDLVLFTFPFLIKGR